MNADQEFELRLNYVDETRPVAPTFDPAIEVYLEDGTTEYANQELEAGDKLVVKGTGFDPAANVPGGSGGVPIPKSLPQGTFAVFGNFAQSWKPSEGAPTSNRVMNTGNRGWALDPAVLAQVPSQYQSAIQNGGYTPLDESGAFTWSVTLAEPTGELPANGNWGIYTYAGGSSGITNAAQELYVPINFKAADDTGDGNENAAVGGLQWAFVNSWNSYLANYAEGTTTVSDGATKGADGVIGYKQKGHNSFNQATKKGNITYQGTVVYKSEAHGFEIAIKDPYVRIEANKAIIVAHVSSSDTSGTSDMTEVEIAEIDHAVTPTEAADGTLTWANVSGTISNEIQPSTWNSNYAGKPMAPVTFSLGADATDEQPFALDITSAEPSAAGIQIQASGTGITQQAGDNGVYFALIEKGTEGSLTNGNRGVVAAHIGAAELDNGAASAELNAVKAKLDRSKSYEVLVWRAHGNATSDRILGRADVNVTEAQWDVVFPPAKATTTAIKFSKSKVAYNSAATATVTVTASGATPTGKVSFALSGKTYSANLANGKATVKLSTAAKAGKHSVKATYTSSDATQFAGSSGSTTLTVAKATPKVSAKLAKSKVKVGKKATVKVAVTVPGSLKAKASKLKVTVYDGKKKIKTATLNSSGKANVKLPKLKKGTHKIKVKVTGNGNLNAKTSATKKLKVIK